MSAREKLLKQFRELVGVRLERVNRRIMELETGASLEAGRTVLRELHGLKGEARMMGFDDINAVVHEMEELVRSTERAEHALSERSIDLLVSRLRQRLGDDARGARYLKTVRNVGYVFCASVGTRGPAL